MIHEFTNYENLIQTYDKVRKIDFSLSSDNFELLISLLGKLLGFESYRPDNVKTSKKDGGPDNLWYATSDDTISYVIECKNRCQGELICKDDANQLRSSVAWFANKYSNKKLYELSQNQGEREVFEKLYPGFIYTGHDVVFNDVDGGIYVYIKMRRNE